MLIAVCGLAGAGKTTATEILEGLGAGARIYVGAFVTAEVDRRGLPRTPENEKHVRKDLRATRMDALAQLALPTISAILSTDRGVLIDAIYGPEELELYRSRFPDKIITLAIETEDLARRQRLAVRASRPISATDLAQRDKYELECLGVARVMEQASHRLPNDASLDDFESALKQFAAAL